SDLPWLSPQSPPQDIAEGHRGGQPAGLAADDLGKRPPPPFPAATSWVTIGPRNEITMAGDTTPKGGWHSGRFAHTFAAIDLGTNNRRVLGARAAAEGYEVIDAYPRRGRRGEGVALTGPLCGEEIERTPTALSVCASKIERTRVTRARHIAT